MLVKPQCEIKHPNFSRHSAVRFEWDLIMPQEFMLSMHHEVFWTSTVRFTGSYQNQTKLWHISTMLVNYLTPITWKRGEPNWVPNDLYKEGYVECFGIGNYASYVPYCLQEPDWPRERPPLVRCPSALAHFSRFPEEFVFYWTRLLKWSMRPDRKFSYMPRSTSGNRSQPFSWLEALP